jgi:hypothetical protein
VHVVRFRIAKVDDRIDLRAVVEITLYEEARSVGEVSSWPEAAGAFHHISVTTQAAAAATPTINMSAKRTSPVRLLLACIFSSPFF